MTTLSMWLSRIARAVRQARHERRWMDAADNETMSGGGEADPLWRWLGIGGRGTKVGVHAGRIPRPPAEHASAKCTTWRRLGATISRKYLRQAGVAPGPLTLTYRSHLSTPEAIEAEALEHDNREHARAMGLTLRARRGLRSVR